MISSSGIKFILFLTVLVVIVNDLGIIATGYYQVGEVAHRIAETAARSYTIDRSKSNAVQVAQEAAGREGVYLTGFEVTNTKVRLSVEYPPRRTWIAYRIPSLRPYIDAQALAEADLR
jgi:hypothetical protein